jgi:hypothetical protein
MDSIRGLGRGATAGLWIVALIPALGLILASVLDRGPTGLVRISAFPMALEVWDPFVRDCLWNSVAVASVVAMGSLVMGIGLARIVARWRFWGRTPLAALTFAPMVVPPVFGAIGLRGCSGRRKPGRGSRSGPGSLRATGGAGSAGSGWGSRAACRWWRWLGPCAGADRPGLRRRRAAGGGEPSPGLAAIDPAARAARRRPRRGRGVRLDAARAGCSAGPRAAADPLLPGRRAALGPDPFPRAAVLDARRPGHRDARPPDPPIVGRDTRATLDDRPRSREETCVGATRVGLRPGPGDLGSPGLAPDPGTRPGRPGGRPSALRGVARIPRPIALARLLNDPESRRLAANSLALGVVVAAIGLFLSWALAGSEPRRRARPRR